MDKHKRSKKLIVIYVVLMLLVIISAVVEFVQEDYSNVFICVLTLIMFMLPSIISRRIKIELPNTLEAIILLFIFASEILGEINAFYIQFPRWDDMLHTLNGFLMGAIGFALIDILNRDKKVKVNLSPLYVAISAFCFSMTIGVMWEFFEYGMDEYFQKDMQKDTAITQITSVMFSPGGENEAITVPIKDVVVNGEEWDYGGYIDIGLKDTMHDLWVNFIGAVTFSIFGSLYIMGRSKFAGKFIPHAIGKRRRPEDSGPPL